MLWAQGFLHGSINSHRIECCPWIEAPDPPAAAIIFYPHHRLSQLTALTALLMARLVARSWRVGGHGEPLPRLTGR